MVVPAVLLLSSAMMGMGGILFGWAKPVPVDWSRLRNPKRDMLWVALAGPASNMLMADFYGFYMPIVMVKLGQGDSRFLMGMAIAGVQVNLVLMALNLLPLPPLDGGPHCI